MIVNIYSVRKYRVGKQKKEKPIDFLSYPSVCPMFRIKKGGASAVLHRSSTKL